MTMATTYDLINSPIGPLGLELRDGALHRVLFDGKEHGDGTSAPAKQLAEYFAGERRSFDLELDLDGTPFQKRVWEELLTIPYGETVTYGELAERVGRPDVIRAVGGAVGRTPAPIVVPCHRVIGADGSLTGYGGGLDRKAALLRLEGAGLQLAIM